MTSPGASPAPPPSAELVGVSKRFGRVTALEGVTLRTRPGEIHALVGENGAGKTTLMRVLSGMIRPDAGEVRVAGRTVRLHKPRDAWAEGVGMVHQHLTLVPHLSVLENVALGVRSDAGGLRLPFSRVKEQLTALSGRTGLFVDMGATVADLSVGERQRVEILKVLYRDPRVLILDEPTSVLAPAEVEELFAVLRGLAGEGRTILLIAHKIEEILAVADRVTVLRSGRVTHEGPAAGVDADALVFAMIGRSMTDAQPFRAVEPGRELAQLVDVGVRGVGGEPALDGVCLSVRAGEIVGVAGVDGNGQRELALLLAGALEPDTGQRSLPETVGFVPEDRMGEALVPAFDLTENVALALIAAPEYRKGPFLRWAHLRETTVTLMERHGVRASAPETRAWQLSGGNQQKVVVGRELLRSETLLVARNPTRGLDVAAARFVREELRGLARRAARGAGEAPGVVVISNDLDEVLELADRLFVLVGGRLLALPEGQRTRAAVGALMLTGREAAGA